MVGFVNNALIASSLGLPRGAGFNMPPPGDPKYLEYLADDNQFALVLASSLHANQSFAGAPPETIRSLVESARANVGNLTPEERAQVIQSASSLLREPLAAGVSRVMQTIERLANNQGYTGPDAATVVATTPAAGGGTNTVTRGEILDNENFGNLVNTAFTAAGGKSYMPAPAVMTVLGRTGMPGDLFNGSGIGIGIDMTKWSEAERIEFLNKVAQFGSDGTMLSRDEQSTLHNMAMSYSRNGDNEPAAVTANTCFGKPTAISKDDLMENGTFEKQLNSMASSGFPFDVANPETKALRDAIATANYDELGYEERVALVQAFNAASGDHKISAQEADGIVKMLQASQKPSAAGGAASAGTTLSNGLVVSADDVKDPGRFMSMVNSVLDRSGVDLPNTDRYGQGYSGSFSNNQYTVPRLRGLDVSMLTAQQRTEILEMISKAGADREITQDEANDIQSRVNDMSGRGRHPFPMGGYDLA
jgi:hypothetical protein